MGEARVVLTLMNADGELTQRFIANLEGETTIVQLANDRFVPFHSEESQTDVGRQLARFHASNLRLVLEPFVQHVTIEPGVPEGPTGSLDGRWVVPPTNPTENSHHYVHLRPEDIIHFEHHNLQIRCSLHNSSSPTVTANMPPAISDAAEGVQVKSSDPGAADCDDQQPLASDSETEDENEEAKDLDRTGTPMNVTPARSRPTTTNEIKETPHHDVDEEEPPFSTALDQADDADDDTGPPNKTKASSEIEFEGATNSPSARAGRQRTERGKKSQEGSLSRVPSFSQGDIAISPHPPKKTYGGRSRRSTPSDRDAIFSDQLKAMSDTDEPGSDNPPVPTSSQVLHPNGAAHEAAKRSLSGKRKLTQEEDGDDESAVKKAKMTPPDEEEGGAQLKAGGENPQAEDEDSDDDGPSQIPAGPRASGRLPRVARAEESDEDNIVAKPKTYSTRPKSSPEIVVQAQCSSKRTSKSASKTPAGTPGTPASTASSSLPGKPPKIITSNATGNYGPNSALSKFIKAQGASIISAIPSRRTNFLCMVKDDAKLIKTPKVLRSLALGKSIVTERWITESKAAGELLDPADFVHPEVADTVELDRRELFFGKVLYFTNAVVKEYGADNWREMQALASEVGASSTDSGSGERGGIMKGRNGIVFIGTAEDKDAKVLVEEHGRVVWHKDLIKDSVVSGELDLESEEAEGYKIKVAAATKKGKGARR